VRGEPSLGDRPGPEIGIRSQLPIAAESQPFARVPGVAAATNLLLLRDGEIYFEGTPEKFLVTKDAYLKQFLASAE
jgi:hypothetical protein